MKKTIHTGLSPNVQTDDLRLARQLLFHPLEWQTGPAAQTLEQEFTKMFNGALSLSVDSGRTALQCILSCLDLKAGDEVLLQAYTCVAVPEPILWIGATPIYVDCEAQTLGMDPQDLERKITPRSKAVIIQHTFGQSADIDAIMAVARKHALVVIEDCAHALGARYHGKLVGSFGDAAFFSFGRDKVISSVFGGMIIAYTSQLQERLQTVHAELPLPKRTWVVQQLLHPIVTTLARTTYSWFGFGKIILELSKRLGIISLAVEQKERRGEKPNFIGHKLTNALALLALHQFQKLETLNHHRQWVAEEYRRTLKRFPLLLPQALADTEPIYLRYTLMSERARDIIHEARVHNIILGDWYRTPIAPTGVSYPSIEYTIGSCPTAERLAQQSVNLPTDIHIGTEEIRAILNAVEHTLHI